MTLTYDSNINILKMWLRTKNEVSMLTLSKVKAQVEDRQTDRQT